MDKLSRILKIAFDPRQISVPNTIVLHHVAVIFLWLKGTVSDCAHVRASSVFSSKDNRTVILTRQDFLPDRTADGDLLFTFSSNILDFRRSFWSSGSKTHRDFVASRDASRPENLVPLAFKTAFLMWNSCQRSIVPSPAIFAWFARVLASNVWKIYINMQSQRDELSQRLVKNYIMIFLNM